MNYRLPPDVLHYEVKLLFGLTTYDIMVSGMALLLGIQKWGPAAGAVIGVLALLAIKKYEYFGGRSPLVYVAMWLWHRYRPQTVTMPRVMSPSSAVQVTVYDWNDNELVRLEGEGR